MGLFGKKKQRRPAFLGMVMMVLTVGLPAAVLGQGIHHEEEEAEERHYPGIFLGATSSSKETNPSLGLVSFEEEVDIVSFRINWLLAFQRFSNQGDF